MHHHVHQILPHQPSDVNPSSIECPDPFCEEEEIHQPHDGINPPKASRSLELGVLKKTGAKKWACFFWNLLRNQMHVAMMRVARSLSCVCKCVSVTLKSHISRHSTAKTHPSQSFFSIPHHVLLLISDTVIFANLGPPQNLTPSKLLGVQPHTLPPNVTPRILFKKKR